MDNLYTPRRSSIVVVDLSAGCHSCLHSNKQRQRASNHGSHAGYASNSVAPQSQYLLPTALSLHLLFKALGLRNI